MKEHLKRRIEYSKDVFPEEGTPEYAYLTKRIQEHELMNPNFNKEIKNKHALAIKTWELQQANGIGLFMDPEIRHYLGEFNHRSWNYGHRKMPLMFNVMEAFFNLDKNLNYWTLLDEEDYSLSFFDFIDFYTSNEFKYDIEEIKTNLEEDLVYNFNTGYDLKEITFKTLDKDEFVIAGVSIVRRGNEVTMLFNTGQVIDTNKKSKELVSLENSQIMPGKEKIKVTEDRTREAVKLNDDPNLWKILVACRFDLDSNTIDIRYVAKDEGNSFTINTDDLTGFMVNGEWRNETSENAFKHIANQVENYNSIFELAKICLFLPNYFDSFNDKIETEEYETKVKTILNSPSKKREYKDVKDKFKIRNKTLWILNRSKLFSSDRIKLKDENFKIENSGYWKKLNDDEIGTNKNGNPITGKTWVQKKESYYVAKQEELIIEKKKNQNFTSKNAGKIYIMRNAYLPHNVYKIGLTTKTTDERASQLSKTSIPDTYNVMREWDAKDCYAAEKTIHKLLEKYRVDSLREFFQIDMRIANDIIDSVIEDINKN